MKQTFLTLLSVLLVTLCSAEAQTTKMTIERIYEKYGERDNIVTMNIPGEMLSEQGGEPTNVEQFIMIVSETPLADFAEDVDALIKDGGFRSLMNVKSEGNRVGFYLSKNKEAFLMVVHSAEGGTVLMCAQGEDLKMQDMMALSKSAINLGM